MNRKNTVSRILCLITAAVMAAAVLASAGFAEQTEWSPRYACKEDFAGTTVAVQTGTITDLQMDMVVDNLQFRRYDDIASMAMALKKGDVDSIMMDEPFARALCHHQDNLAIYSEVFFEDQYSCILKKGSEYTQPMNAIIEEFLNDGTIESLKNKWLSGNEDTTFIDYSQYNLADRGNGVLRIGCTADAMPMVYVAGPKSEMQGFEVELMLMIADKLDMGVELSQSLFAGLLPSVTTGKIDIAVSSISVTEERQQSFDIPIPYYLGGVVAVCRSEDILPPGADMSLNSPSITIAVEPTTTMEEAVLSTYPNAKVIFVNSFSEGLLSLSAGKANVLAANNDQYLGMKEEKADTYRLHSDGVIGNIGECAAGISPKTRIPNAKGMVDAFIAEAEANGTLEEMKQRWLYDADYTMPEIPHAQNPEMKIVFGTTGLCAPSSFYKDNAITGLEIELMQRFALWCNADYEIVTYDWNGIIPACISGNVDYVFTNLIVTEERREMIDFSRPYQTIKTVMVIRNKQTQSSADFLTRLAGSFEKTFLRESRWMLIVRGLMVTLEIALLSGILGTVLGFGYSFLTRSKNKLVVKLSRGFSALVSGIPSLVVLLIINFVVFASADIDPKFVGIISFSLMFMFSVAGLLNTGIDAVDAGQSEAADALGFSRASSFFHVVLPQAVRHVMPLYKGEFGAMLRLTSIVGYISIEDLTKAGDIIRSRTYEAFLPLISTALIYFAVSSAVAALLGTIDRKIDPKHRTRRLPKGVVALTSVPPLKAKKKAVESDEIIRIEHLMKSFPDGTPLTDVCTSIKRGDVITIIGPSGTGKSTLMRCINRLEIPTKGKVIVFGEDICGKRVNISSLRRRMGMVFQSFNLFGHLTVLENIMLAPTILKKQPKQEAYERAMQLLQSVGMSEKALRYPNELSGGQKQRVAIARTLAMDPEIVLFDEPTSALDPTMVGEVLSVIRRLADEGLTMMIVTHEMQFARDVSSRIFYMDQGIIYEDGTPDTIFDAPKKDRTRAFVQKLKVLSLEIANRDYDFIGMNEQIKRFGEAHYLAHAKIDSIQRAFEELCSQNIVPNKDEDSLLTVLVEYAEANEEINMRFKWAGRPYNPMEEGDELSIMLVKHYLHSFDYSYVDGENRLTVCL